MKLIFLGPPGAGKGTLAARVSEMLKVPQISTGAIFRAAIAANSPLGQQVKAVLDSGQLVDDGLTVALVKDRLSQNDAKNGYILDGFPRSIAQADALALFSAVDKAINFEISDDDVVKRLGGRRVCPDCGVNYHIETLKPVKEGVCDKCGTALIIRDDDRPDTITRRLQVYRTSTEPLIGYYRAKGILAGIDATGPVDVMVEHFKKAVQ